MGLFQIPFRLSGSVPPSRRTFGHAAARRIDFPYASLLHHASELDTGNILAWIGGSSSSGGT
jgi:hypothetical protein